MPKAQSRPLVSVLMPTYKQADFIRRALESLRSQSFTDWELILVNDCSPDNTHQVIEPYLQDKRIRYFQLDVNQGIGAALNTATSLAIGEYIAYLPSDDLYYPEHLARLVQTLNDNPGIFLAYGGVRWNYEIRSATLQGDSAIGHEAYYLLNPPEVSKTAKLNNGNLFALVQVMHRRSFEKDVTWTPRSKQVSDRLEADFWRELLQQGAKFCYTEAITCEWVDHFHQHHKLVASKEGGLSRYRQYYRISQHQPLNWQPSFGPCVNEEERYKRFTVVRELPEANTGLKILLVGEVGFNPERLMAFEERGHKLYGLWYPFPESWDTTGPLAFGNVEDIPFNSDWVNQVARVKPDIIYALLNWQAIPFISQIFISNPGIPFIFHFKEGPFICQEKGTWPLLIQLLLKSDGQIFINQESFEWFQLALDGTLNPANTLILDGDLPKRDWFTKNWSSKLSAKDGQIHTVCAGRIIGIEPFSELVEQKIHIHFYGTHFHQMSPNFVREGLAKGLIHLHPTVEPWDWVRELSQYDAAWFHIYDSHNRGDLRQSNWDDLNLPARLGMYAAAGLPWILKDNRHSRSAIQSLAQHYDVGIFFNNFAELGNQLRDQHRLGQLTTNMQNASDQFAFDTYVEKLIGFFRQTIKQRQKTTGKYNCE